jgi:hypothetical protein
MILCNEQLHHLRSSSNIIRMANSWRMRWRDMRTYEGDEECIGMRAYEGDWKCVQIFVVGKPEGKRPVRRPRRR